MYNISDLTIITKILIFLQWDVGVIHELSLQKNR